MRTPKRLVDARSGETYYRVRYRNPPGGPQRTLHCRGETAKQDAERFIRWLDAMGPEDAVRHWNAHLDDIAPDNGPTVNEWWVRYLAAATGLTDGTRLTYDRVYARVWSPLIGSKPLAAVTREDIALAVNAMSQVKADKTVKNHYGVIASMFKSAVAEGLIPVTPCTKIKMPRRTEHTAVEHRYLTYSEWGRLRDELAGLGGPNDRGHYVPLFTTFVGTGIRWGEAEAATVGDVILDAVVELDGGVLEVVPQLRINKAAKWNASKSTRQVGPTKTRKSNRTVALPAEVVAVLEPLLAGRKSGDRLFLAPKGGPLRHRTVYDTWKIAVERAGLEPQPRIHDLRHTHVAWLIAQGMPIPVIQHRLGHESGATTNDVYGHLVPDLQISAARAASLAMKPRSVNGGVTPKEIEP